MFTLRYIYNTVTVSAAATQYTESHCIYSDTGIGPAARHCIYTVVQRIYSVIHVVYTVYKIYINDIYNVQDTAVYVLV
jgi:hypothetical protein